MSQSFRCGDPEALVSYLYEEDSPSERRSAEAHLATCEACAEEIEALGGARVHLLDWAPPAASLEFQVTRRTQSPRTLPTRTPSTPLAFTVPASRTAADTGDAPVDFGGAPAATGGAPQRTLPWWRQPMPAWMQAAAAIAVFGAGLAVGARQAAPAPTSPAASVAQAAPGATPGPASEGAVPVSASELAKLEERLRQEIAQVRAAQSAGSPTPVAVARRAEPDDAVLSRMQALIGESEERQRRELALRTAQVVRDLDAQRRDDLTRVQATMGQIEGSTGAELRQQNRELWNFLMNNVSQRGTVR